MIVDQLHIIIFIMKLLLLVILLITSSCLTTITYTYSSQTGSAALENIYPLGTLAVGANLSASILLPNGGSLTSMSIINSAGTSTNLPLSGNTGIFTITTASTYNIRVIGTPAPSTTVTIFYLTVSINNAAIVKLSDVFRTNIVFRYFYRNSVDPTPFYITVSPASATPTISFYAMTNKFTSGPAALASPTTVNGALVYATGAIAQGYYGFTVTTSVPTSTVTITYQTSPYICPYISTMPDYNSNFGGCSSTSSTSLPGIPCINYDYTNLICLNCVAGYTVSNGGCVVSSNCTSRQYFHFGKCYPVSVLCETFDQYTGFCLTCFNATKYNITNGVCVSNSNVCTNGSILINNNCVSAYCSTVLSNGTCSSCISAAFYLSAGTCLPINCGTGNYFSLTLNNCTAIPSVCTNFSLTSQACYSCISGYFLTTTGVCLQPAGSANCLIWDFLNNVCSACTPKFVLAFGACTTQAIVPSQCGTGQQFVNGICAYLPSNCLSINNYYICTQCAPKHRMVSGVCTPCTGSNSNFPCVTCPYNYYINATGSCIAASVYCLTIDLIGNCLTCTNGVPAASGVCCAVGQTVQNGVCTNNSNNGGSGPVTPDNFKVYYKYCMLYSPPQKICTQCLNGHQFDFSDHCA